MRSLRRRPSRAGQRLSALLAVESYRRTFEYIEESRLPDHEIEQILYRNASALFDFATDL
ncbi:hypothetical protein AB0M22_17490 [Nocardia sp. NPDC051756]|uniref:hypothetical protein n=1 Tax=Nocardia sp. NPDC051756 TaxID=3154751 RepID=UPI00344AB791